MKKILKKIIASLLLPLIKRQEQIKFLLVNKVLFSKN